MKKTCVLLTALALAGCASPRGDVQTSPAKAPAPADGPAQMPPNTSPVIASNIPPSASRDTPNNIHSDFSSNNPPNTALNNKPNSPTNIKTNTPSNIPLNTPLNISHNNSPNTSSTNTPNSPSNTSPNNPTDISPNTPPNAPAKLAGGMGAAMVSPLNDFNLVRDEIPALLLTAREAPYALPADRSCAALAADIAALDEVLGADLDAPPSPDRPSLLARGVDEAGHAAVNAVQGAVSGAIPFRGWVRKLTGADRYARKVAAAITAGGVRRAFLKGLSRAQDCAPAPQPPLQAGAARQAPAMPSMQEKAQPSGAAPVGP